ncbi:MAG: cell division protein ZapA [Roseiarcus sp.]|jgi:cell division protein ZapA
MAQVAVTIGGRTYRLACNEGEEEHLESLARLVDSKFDTIHKSFGEIGDQRLIVMAALTIADELTEARARIAALEAEAGRGADRERAGRHDAEIQAVAVAQAFGDLSQRIEKLAATLSGAAAS